MNQTPLPRPVSYRELLRNRNYMLLWLGQMVSVFGDRLHQIALVVLVGSLTGNDLVQIGLVFATIGVPSLLFGLLAGALVDRWNRQHVMIAADLLRFFLVASIPTLASLSLVWVYVITALLTTVTLFFRPAKDGSIPNIVSTEELLMANSLSSATDTMMDVLGYPLAGALIGGLSGILIGNASGINLAFYVDAGTYLFSAIMILRMTFPTRMPVQSQVGIGGVLRMIGEGMRFIQSHAVLLTNVLVIAFSALVGGGVAILSFGYAAKLPDTAGFGYSILQASIGLGNVLGGLAIGKWGERFPKGPLILIGLIFTGIASITLAFFNTLLPGAFLLMMVGIGNMMFFIPSITLVQRLTPDAFRGRVLSFRSTLISIALITSNVLLGIGAEKFDVHSMFAISGGLLVLIGLLAFLVPSARNASEALA